MASLSNKLSKNTYLVQSGAIISKWPVSLKHSMPGMLSKSSLGHLMHLGFYPHQYSRSAAAAKLTQERDQLFLCSRFCDSELEKVLGAEHTDTLLRMHNLAYVYKLQERYSKAEIRYKRVLAGREVFGAEHRIAPSKSLRVHFAPDVLSDLKHAQEVCTRSSLAHGSRVLQSRHVYPQSAPSGVTILIRQLQLNGCQANGKFHHQKRRRFPITFHQTSRDNILLDCSVNNLA